MSIRLCPGDTTLSERRFCCHKSKRMGIQIWFDVDGNFDEEPEGRSEGGENRQAAARTMKAQKQQTRKACHYAAATRLKEEQRPKRSRSFSKQKQMEATSRSRWCRQKP